MKSEKWVMVAMAVATSRGPAGHMASMAYKHWHRTPLQGMVRKENSIGTHKNKLRDG